MTATTNTIPPASLPPEHRTPLDKATENDTARPVKCWVMPVTAERLTRCFPGQPLDDCLMAAALYGIDKWEENQEGKEVQQ